MTDILNLQNTANGSDIVVESVEFASGKATLKGLLFMPVPSEGMLPALIVTGAWTTVKEQMPGTYARELARRGIAALVFDFAGWGESNGTPRFVEDPATKTADIHAAVSFLQSRPDVDDSKLYGLGVCASSGYMATAVAGNGGLRKLALVAPWLHDPEMAEAIYGGAEAASGLIAVSDEAAKSAEPTILTAASTSDDSAPMYQAPYYTEEDRGLIAEYDNKFSVLSWKPWLTYDAQASADRLTKPILMVGSNGMALPAGAQAYEKRTSAPVGKMWLGEEISQFDFYDRKDIVLAASDAVAEFFNA